MVCLGHYWFSLYSSLKSFAIKIYRLFVSSFWPSSCTSHGCISYPLNTKWQNVVSVSHFLSPTDYFLLISYRTFKVLLTVQFYHILYSTFLIICFPGFSSSSIVRITHNSTKYTESMPREPLDQSLEQAPYSDLRQKPEEKERDFQINMCKRIKRIRATCLLYLSIVSHSTSLPSMFSGRKWNEDPMKGLERARSSSLDGTAWWLSSFGAVCTTTRKWVSTLECHGSKGYIRINQEVIRE